MANPVVSGAKRRLVLDAHVQPVFDEVLRSGRDRFFDAIGRPAQSKNDVAVYQLLPPLRLLWESRAEKRVEARCAGANFLTIS